MWALAGEASRGDHGHASCFWSPGFAIVVGLRLGGSGPVKVLAPAILLLEAIVVGLAIPVALMVDGGGARAAWVLGGLAVLLVLASGVARRPQGVAIGWVCQVLVLLSGILVPAMAFVGLVFLAVWVVAVIYGGKADRAAAARAAAAPPSEPADPSA
jgi:hypothetical protein